MSYSPALHCTALHCNTVVHCNIELHYSTTLHYGPALYWKASGKKAFQVALGNHTRSNHCEGWWKTTLNFPTFGSFVASKILGYRSCGYFFLQNIWKHKGHWKTILSWCCQIPQGKHLISRGVNSMLVVYDVKSSCHRNIFFWQIKSIWRSNLSACSFF